MVFRSGFVNIYGKPNAGKSTLLNQIIDEKISIVSPKAQTTRKNFKGILNHPSYQIVFVDTPGFITHPQYELHHRMVQEIENSKKGSDASILLIDCKQSVADIHQTLTEFAFPKPLFFVLNKIDTISALTLEDKVRQIQKEIPTQLPIFCISATQKKQITPLINALVEVLPVHEPYFDTDALTDKNLRFISAEFIRESIFHLYEQEIPYSSSVVIQEYIQRAHITKISADIVLQREQQKIIVLGKNGSKIKQVGILSRQKIERLIGQKVFLELFVKVRDNWKNNPVYLKEFGY